MELTGNEKRIQALFSERSREDAQVAPEFGKVWRAALAAQQAPRSHNSLALKVAVAATVIVGVAVLFVAWSQNKVSRDKWSPSTSTAAHSVQQATAQPVAVRPAPIEPENKVAQRRKHSHSPRARTLARRQQRASELEQQAAMLANWKSPTENFMTSPTPSGFGSLPQLNESVKDLQSFLSQNKESNQ